MSRLTVEEVAGADAFDRLRADWQALFSAAAGASPFLSWEWIASWHRWLGGGRTARLFCARRGADLVGLLPLTEARCWGTRVGGGRHQRHLRLPGPGRLIRRARP